jgi:hypothetical protein
MDSSILKTHRKRDGTKSATSYDEQDDSSESDGDSHSDSSGDGNAGIWTDSDVSECDDSFNASHTSRSLLKAVSFSDHTYCPPGVSGDAAMKSHGKMKVNLASSSSSSSSSSADRHSTRPVPITTRASLKPFDESRVSAHSCLTNDRGSSPSISINANLSNGENNNTQRGSRASFPVRRSGSSDSQLPKVEAAESPSVRKMVAKQMSMNSSNRTSVGVKMKIKLDYIDDVNQEIHTEVFLSMHYRCSRAREFISGQTGFVALCPLEHPEMYVPMVEFLNFRSCDHIEGFRLLVNTKSGVVYIYRVYRIVFRGLLKLDRFPFDRQIINIELKSFTAMLVPWSMPEADVPYGIRADVLWRNHDIVVECDGSLWDLNWTKGVVHQETNPSVYVASFGIGRISLFYIMNFFLVTFFVVGSTFGCLAINYTDFGTRSSITFTILLTVISTKFIMSSYTPKINYLTWLDYYNLLGMVFVIIIILENYVVSTVSSFSFVFLYPLGWGYYTLESAVIDVYVPLIMLWMWILFHVFIFLGWLYGWFYESWEQVQHKDNRSEVARISGDVTAA